MWEFQDVPHGTVRLHDYQSTSLGRLRHLRVYTPPGYEQRRSRYPVLYLFHGSGDNEATWTALGRAHVILDNLIAQGRARPMLVVMPLGYGTMEIVSPLKRLDAAANLRVYGLTAVWAPLGLRVRLQHRWYLKGEPVCASPFYEIVGGREAGFRLWTSCVFPSISEGDTVRLEVETDGRQLISRTAVPPAR